MAILGSNTHPAIVRTQTMERAEELLAIAIENGWQIMVGVEPDKPEDLGDLELLMHGRHLPVQLPPSARVGRNDPCPCGSGMKFKKCCAVSQRMAA